MNDGIADGLVLFGITGDLAYKKLFPALYRLYDARRIKGPLIGVASLGVDASRSCATGCTTRCPTPACDVDPKVLDGLTEAIVLHLGQLRGPGRPSTG